MNDLAHAIVEIVKAEDAVGGIMATALINRVLAKLVHDKKFPIPSHDDVKQAIFDLLSSEALVLTPDRKLRPPQPKAAAKQKGTPQANSGNQSGIWPIGPGDPVFNAAGEMIAVVSAMQKITGPGGMHEVRLEVQATFNRLQAYDGTSFSGAGEILTGKRVGFSISPTDI